MEDKFKISIHKDSLSSKPKVFNGLMTGYTEYELTVDQLSTAITNGHTILPSLIGGKRKINRNFNGSQVIMLDYDSDKIVFNEKDEIARIEELGFKVNIVYNSFSHKEESPRFRLIIIFDTIIKSSIDFKNLIKGFISIGGSDKACSDVARMYYAGNNVRTLNTCINSFSERALELKTICPVKENRAKRRYSDSIDKNVTNIASSININSQYNESNTFELRNYNFEIALQNSKLLLRFSEGKGARLRYAQIRNLITNFQYVRGGLKWVREKMLLNINDPYQQYHFNLFYNIPRANYLPERIDSFDESLADEYHNILELENKIRKNTIMVTNKVEKQHIDVVSENLKEHFKNSKESVNRVSVIVAPTGTGKTELMINEENVLIALPNHKLKEEVAQRMTEKNLPFVITPKQPEFETEAVNVKITELQSMGESSMASNLIRCIAEGSGDLKIDYSDNDRIIARTFRDELQAAYASETTVLTTHSRVMLAPKLFKNKSTVIFDEDIMSDLMVCKNIGVKTIERVLDKAIKMAEKQLELKKTRVNKDFLRDLTLIHTSLASLQEGHLGNISNDLVFSNKTYLIDKLSQIRGASHLINLINADKILRRTSHKSVVSFHYGKINSFSDIFHKVIVLSATAERYFYNELLKKEKGFDWFHCGFAQNIKPIKQYNSKSYSRSTVKKGDVPEVETDIVLTYKPLRDKFTQEQQPFYFGNLLGIDCYKGKDISIVGTPIEPVETTMLRASLLGKSIVNQTKSMQEVELEGFKFSFMTFENKDLQQIELRIASQSLKQSLGRGRTSRTESNTHLYSSIPMAEADIQEGKNMIYCLTQNVESLSTEFVKSDFNEVMAFIDSKINGTEENEENKEDDQRELIFNNK